jgi:hypothetical protein
MPSDFLRNSITQSAIQDSLLQSYRSISLALQSIFLGVGVFLLTRIIEAVDLNNMIQFAIPLLLLCFIAVYINIRLTSVILCRGKDVSFWHKQVITIEQQLEPKLRYFTKFKISQKHHRDGSEYLSNIVNPSDALNADQIDSLIGKGLGHTRKVIDKYIPGSMLLSWVFIIIIAGYKIYHAC